MQLTIDTTGLAGSARRVADMPRQVRFAASQALNGAAYKVREDWRAEINRVFDRPTDYIHNSPFVSRTARPESLVAEIQPRYPGGKGVDPAKVLLAEVMGGRRHAKRFEVALQRAGILPRGFAAVPASWVVNDPTKGDGHGGVKGSFIVQLLSYLQAFSEQGYRANMTARNRLKMSGRGRWVNGRFVGAHTKAGAAGGGAAAFRQGGVEYFVSRGKGTSIVTRKAGAAGRFADGADQHLRAGIWQRTGLYGAVVKPVFLFVPLPRYTVRLSLATLRQRAVQQHFPPLFRQHLRQALETARTVAT